MSSTISTVLCVLALGLIASGCESPEPRMCLPAAREDGSSEEIPTTDPDRRPSLDWYCADPPPDDLLDGTYYTDLVWVALGEGEECDPCDLERIAGAAAAQACSGDRPARLLCGPLPDRAYPWEPPGCLYAVAASDGCAVE